MPQFCASFNNAHKRIQSGGWAREVTQADFPISTTVSGVNMRLGPGGIRELHWHQSAEWGYMTNLRIPHRGRRRQGIRIQHAAGDRLARTHSRLADAHAARGELGDRVGCER
jgi:hypothetical protein